MSAEKKRGALLTIWLVGILINNIIIALLALLGGGFVSSVLQIPVWVFYVSGLFALLNIVFTIFLFIWKKWAFFALCGSAGVVIVFGIIMGIGVISVLYNLASAVLGLGILYLLMRPKWNLFG